MSPPVRTSLTRVALIGVTGRMGQALLRAAPAFPQLLHHRRGRLAGQCSRSAATSAS